MSSNSNFNKNKCWSCEYYCCKREYKRGVFLSDSVHTDIKGTCSNKRSEKNGKEVFEDGWCSRYQKWSILQSALAAEAQKRASERMKTEQRRERSHIDEGNVQHERIRTEDDNKRGEHDSFHNSLSSEERLDEEVEFNKTRKTTKIKKGLIVGGIIAAVITIVIVSSVCISNAIKNKKTVDAFANSNTGKLIALIQKENNGKNEFYFQVDRDEGCEAHFGFEYKKNGWIDEFGTTRDFRVYCQLSPRSEDQYKEITGFCFFNLDDGGNNKTNQLNGRGACFNSYAKYGVNSHVLTQYQNVFYSKHLNHSGQYYKYDQWDNIYDDCINEWTDRGFVACDLANTLVDQYCVSAFGASFWK